MPKHTPLSTTASQVRLAGDAQAPPPSAARKRFDSLVRRLESRRERLHAWSEALPRWRERYHEQAGPLFRRREELDLEQVRLLEHADAAYRLGKAERAFLSELICELAAALIEAGHDELRPLYERHAEVSFEQDQAEADRLLRQMVEAEFGLDLEEMQGVDAPEALFEHLRERLQQQQAHAREREAHAQARRARRKRTPAEAEQPAPPPLRELYRRLATALHPDREPDPAERERKTQLMQRLNQAYAAGNLLALIELQLEIGQLSPEQLQRMSEARIKDYNRELDRQLRQVEQELEQVEQSFRADYGLYGGARLDPQRLDALLAQIKRELADDVEYLQHELRQLQQPTAFRHWLKRERERARHAHASSAMPGGDAW